MSWGLVFFNFYFFCVSPLCTRKYRKDILHLLNVWSIIKQDWRSLGKMSLMMSPFWRSFGSRRSWIFSDTLSLFKDLWVLNNLDKRINISNVYRLNFLRGQKISCSVLYDKWCCPLLGWFGTGGGSANNSACCLGVGHTEWGQYMMNNFVWNTVRHGHTAQQCVATFFLMSSERFCSLLGACWWCYSMGQLIAPIISSWLECFWK